MKKGRVLVLITLALLSWARTGFGSALTLEWDASPDPDVVGYQLYYGGSSQQYTNFVSTGLTTKATVDNLADGVTYYFAATCLNSAGLESGFSGEIAYFISGGSCSIVLSNLDQVYDGTPKAVSVSTTPGAFGVSLDYAGEPDPPTEAGSYLVTGVSADPGCTATTNGVLTIEPAPATVQLTNLEQTFDGGPKTAGITTTPPGLGLRVTYNGQPEPPTQAGTYAVSATITDPNYSGSANALLVIEPATAEILLEQRDQVYDGTPKQIWTMTLPPGLALILSYNGGTDWPVNAGTYTVSGTVDDPNYLGSKTVLMVVQKAELPILLGNLNQVYDGTPKSISVDTTVTNLPVLTTYDGQPSAPIHAGNYALNATLLGSNYTGTATGMLYVAKAEARIQLSDLTPAYDGTPKSATVTTTPPGLGVTVTYDGSAQAPSVAGVYDVVATVVDPDYQGSVLASLTISSGGSTARGPSEPTAPDLQSPGVPPISAQQTLSLTWGGNASGVTLWQSTNLLTWAPVTGCVISSNSVLVRPERERSFFRATARNAEAEIPLPLRIGKR